MMNVEVGSVESANIALAKIDNDSSVKPKRNKYIDQACLLSNSRIKFSIVRDSDAGKTFIDLRHLKHNKLTKRGVRLGIDEFKEVLNIPRLQELLIFYESNK